MTKIGLWLGAAAVAALAYITAVSPALQQGLGASAAAIVRPLVIPLIELINVPAFVYCAALVIFMAGLAACVVYQIDAVRPYLAELRAVRSAVGDLPQPRLNGVVTAEAWAEARQHLGTLLHGHALFVAAWSAFQAGIRHQEAPPYHGADPEQPDLDLHDAGCIGDGGAASGPAAGCGCFEGRGTSQPYRACPYASRGPHTSSWSPTRMARWSASRCWRARSLPPRSRRSDPDRRRTVPCGLLRRSPALHTISSEERRKNKLAFGRRMCNGSIRCR